eukprot:gene7848-18608_t
MRKSPRGAVRPAGRGGRVAVCPADGDAAVPAASRAAFDAAVSSATAALFRADVALLNTAAVLPDDAPRFRAATMCLTVASLFHAAITPLHPAVAPSPRANPPRGALHAGVVLLSVGALHAVSLPRGVLLAAAVVYPPRDDPD